MLYYFHFQKQHVLRSTVRVPCYPLAQKPSKSKPTTMTRQTDQAAVDRTARTAERESQFRAIISVLPYQVHECGHCQYLVFYLTNIYKSMYRLLESFASLSITS